MGMGDRRRSWERGSEPFEAPLAPHLQKKINLTRIKSMSYSYSVFLFIMTLREAYSITMQKLISGNDIIFAPVQYQHDIMFALLLICSESSFKNKLSEQNSVCCFTSYFQTLRTIYMTFWSIVTSYFTTSSKMTSSMLSSTMSIFRNGYKVWDLLTVDNTGLLNWYWWILCRAGISKDASLRASADIPSRDNINQYQCVITLLLYSCK